MTFAQEMTDNLLSINHRYLEDADSFWESEIWLVIQILLGLTLLVGCCYCNLAVVTNIYLETRREEQRLIRQQQLTDNLHADPKYREKVIYESLIIQRVIRAADENGNLTLGDVVADEKEVHDVTYPKTEPDEENQANEASIEKTVDDDDDDDMLNCNSCAICMEPYRVHDIVAWSRYSFLADQEKEEGNEKSDDDSNQKIIKQLSSLEQTSTDTTTDTNSPSATSNRCLHVFHRDCIVPWLKNKSHDDCPSCRTVLLRFPGDNKNDKEEEKTFPRESGTFLAFVIVQGLISQVVRHYSASRANSDSGKDDCASTLEAEDIEKQLGNEGHPGPQKTSASGRGQKQKVLSFDWSSLRRNRRLSDDDDEEADQNSSSTESR